MIKFLKFGLLFVFTLTVFSAEVDFSYVQKINENTLENINLANQYRDSNIHLEQIYYQLKTDRAKTQNCLNMVQKILDELKSNQFILHIQTKLPSLKNQQDEFQKKWLMNQEQEQFCHFLQNQIIHAELKISQLLYENSKENLFKRNLNILQVLQVNTIVHVYHFPLDLMKQSNVLQPLKLIVVSIILFSILRFIAGYVAIIQPFFTLAYSKIFYIAGIFVVIYPYFYQLLGTIYEHNIEQPLILYEKSVMRSLFIIVFYILLRRIESKHVIRDIGMMLLGLLGYGALLFCAAQISQNELLEPTATSLSTILFWKYIFLLSLPLSTAIFYYFMRYRLVASLPEIGLGFQLFSWIFIDKTKFLLAFFSILWVIGFSGYVDFVVAMWLMLMVVSVLLLWLVIAKYALDNLIRLLENANSSIGKLSYHYLFTSKDQFFLEIRSLKYIFLFGSRLVIFFIAWTMCFLPSRLFFKTYNFMFISQKAFDTDLIIINIIYALGIFLLLNIINRFFSIYFARKISDNAEHFEKVRSLLYLIGLIITALICFKISKVEFKSLGFILGGLSFGLGIGLRDIIGNFISGLVLMFANPIAKGHYVEVGDERGFVKRITLMETQIESFDKVAITLSNLKVLQSAVHNYSSAKNRPPRFHFKFIFTNISDLKSYEKTILEIVAQEKDVIMTGPFAPTFLVLPGSNPLDLKEIELDLGFSVHHFEHLWQVISNLTENLIMAFKDTETPVYLRASGLPLK